MVAQYAQNVRSIRVSLRSGPPGSGKTYKLSKDWERFPGKKLLLSHSHEYLTEQECRWSERMAVRHLWGLRWKCPCLNTERYYNKMIAKLIELKLPYSHVCNTCKIIEAYPQELCPYKAQFISLPDTVIAPIEYALYTNFLDEYKPDYIAVDDCTLRMREHPTKKTLEHYLQHLQRIDYYLSKSKNYVKNLRQLFSLNEKDYNSFMRKLYHAHNSWLKMHVDEIVNENIDIKKIMHVTISPEEFDIYRKHAVAFGFREKFGTPALFPLFDYVATRKFGGRDEPQLKIIDAIIKDEVFKGLQARYQRQEKVYIDFRDDDFEYKITDHGSIVYRCRSRADAWYPSGTSVVDNVSMRLKMQQWIGQILRQRHNSGAGLKIGLVFPKLEKNRNIEKVDWWKQFIPKDLNIVPKWLTFGNLRGKNSLEDCDVLFVISTYNTNHEALIEDFSKFFAHDPSSIDYWENERHGGHYHFRDGVLDAFRWCHEEYEEYQAVHRSRPMIHKKVIYVIGEVPIEIENDGLQVKNFWFERGDKLKEDRSEWILNYVKQFDKVLVRETAFAVKNEFGISLKSAYNAIHKAVDGSKHICIISHQNRMWLRYDD